MRLLFNIFIVTKIIYAPSRRFGWYGKKHKDDTVKKNSPQYSGARKYNYCCCVSFLFFHSYIFFHIWSILNVYFCVLFLLTLFYLFAAAAAKSLQSCPTLCDPIDGSPPGSPVPGILQARTLEWVAISFSNAWKWKVKVKSFSHVQLFATPWTAAYQAPPSMGFSRQEYWSGVPLPSPNLLPEVSNSPSIFRYLYINIINWFLIIQSSDFIHWVWNVDQ